MSAEAERWNTRVKLVEARAAFAREVLEGRWDFAIRRLETYRKQPDLFAMTVTILQTLRQMVGLR